MVVQVDGLAMGASLAVILADLWLKKYEFALGQEIPVGTEIQQTNEKKNGLCPCCSRKVTYRSKGVECESCLSWYHLKCGKISDDVYASKTEIVWYCKCCCRAKNKEKDTPQVKLFLRCVLVSYLKRTCLNRNYDSETSRQFNLNLFI